MFTKNLKVFRNTAVIENIRSITMTEERKIIDERNYSFQAPKQAGPAAVGRGGDPLFRNIRATKAQLVELLDETTVVQDWIQRETSNKVALSCLDNENLKEIYFEIKDGFGEYGPIVLMGFKTPQGIEIPRLKILDKEGEVKEVLSGPMVIDELNRRAEAFKVFKNGYESLDLPEETLDSEIKDYTGVIVEENEVIADYKGNA